MKPASTLFTCVVFFTSCLHHRKTDPILTKDSVSTNQILEKAKDNVSGDLAGIDALVTIATDSISTISEKRQAFEGLSELYPDYFLDMNKVKESAKRLEDSLIYDAEVKIENEQKTNNK